MTLKSVTVSFGVEVQVDVDPSAEWAVGSETGDPVDILAALEDALAKGEVTQQQINDLLNSN